jgi:hypothetical protein
MANGEAFELGGFGSTPEFPLRLVVLIKSFAAEIWREGEREIGQ